MEGRDLSGKRYNGFTVLREADRDNGGNRRWWCKCDCGNEWICGMPNLSRTKGCKRCMQKGRVRKVFYIPNSGERFREYTLSHGLSFAEMSRRTGISVTTIEDFLYNGRDISSARLAKMCAFAGVSMDYVMGLKEG